MVVTMVDAEVAPERANVVHTMWLEITDGPIPPGLLRSYLLRAGDAWRIATVWQSRDALDAMRNSGETPGAIRVFAAAGAEPKVTIYEIEGTVEAPD